MPRHRSPTEIDPIRVPQSGFVGLLNWLDKGLLEVDRQSREILITGIHIRSLVYLPVEFHNLSCKIYCHHWIIRCSKHLDKDPTITDDTGIFISLVPWLTEIQDDKRDDFHIIHKWVDTLDHVRQVSVNGFAFHENYVKINEITRYLDDYVPPETEEVSCIDYGSLYHVSIASLGYTWQDPDNVHFMLNCNHTLYYEDK
jgi:hypothetical protein